MTYRFQSICIVLFILLAQLLTPAQVRAGDIFVSDGGKAVAGAKVTVQPLSFGTATTVSTNKDGVADAKFLKELNAVDAAQDALVTTVLPNGQTESELVTLPPASKAWRRMAIDSKGGFIGLSQSTFDALKESHSPINVGPNSEVGTGARTKDKVIGLATNVLGGFLGGGGSKKSGGGFGGLPLGGGKKKGQDIETERDPISDETKRILTDPATGTTISVGTQITPDGLLVSTKILNSPDDGTFQAVYLMDPQGRKAGPTGYAVYEMYQDWKLTVTWTKDHYINGEHVSHQEGGWSENGRNILGTFTVPMGKDGIWSQLGFSNAVMGVKSLGATFPISASTLINQPMNLVVHVTNPGDETVTTVPFVVALGSPAINIGSSTTSSGGVDGPVQSVALSSIRTDMFGSSPGPGPEGEHGTIYTDDFSSEKPEILVLDDGRTFQLDGDRKVIAEIETDGSRSPRDILIDLQDPIPPEQLACPKVHEPSASTVADDLLTPGQAAEQQRVLRLEKRIAELKGKIAGLKGRAVVKREDEDTFCVAALMTFVLGSPVRPDDDPRKGQGAGITYPDEKVAKANATLDALEQELSKLEQELDSIDSVASDLDLIIVLT